ncbi:hypothetical protein SCHPADRAFT_727113 [Schizopora paradoxa]|uniref:HNH nuclease domain-containing protein n=1 Tax=Schizopora paradoxa TaxID=27342 RepID=A0A0H2R146_9AGAM|nr:hypothetical protein SCHPADRAFT_727113 [Schizopora paradoxa]
MSFSLSRDANARSELDCIKLHITINGDTCPVFEIPRVDFKNFTTFPLKWLRFLGFTIYGAEGHISLAVDGEPVNDSVGVDDVNLLSNTYYYVSQAPPKVFDVINAMDSRSSVGSTSSLRDGSFREKILLRDVRCTMNATQDVQKCHACHIIPHSKGDDLIKELTSTYAATDTEIVDDINDVRNGLLLHESIHPLLDHSDVAILKTPNFAMQPTDVPGISNQEERFTYQWFPARNRVEDSFNQQMRTFHNVNASFPRAGSTIDLKKPSVILLNVMYATSALKAWGMVDFARFIGGALHDAPEGRTTRSAQSKTNLSPNMHMLGATASPSFSATNTAGHTGRATSGRTSGSRNDLIDFVYQIRRKVLGDIEVNAEEIAKRRSTEKVMEWFSRAAGPTNGVSKK